MSEIVEETRIRELYPLAIHDINSNKKDVLQLTVEKKEKPKMGKKETPVLVAAKNGITEMVERILELFPVAIHDMNTDKKNIVLLAVENRQPHVYKLLIEMKSMKKTVFREVDKDGNSALHLAAMLGKHQPWLISGAALQMQWELKWYEFVENSMPSHTFPRYNKEGETASEVFTRTHKDLVNDGFQWLSSTSNSCSVVATLITTVAFATSTAIPGGPDQTNGAPTFRNDPVFKIFSYASLVALSFSVSAAITFLAILTSPNREIDFSRNLPYKLLLGLTTLFISLAAMLMLFYAGHLLTFKDQLESGSFFLYALTLIPVLSLTIIPLPVYFDLLRITFRPVPQRIYKVVTV